MAKRIRIGVLVSRSGSNLQAIMDACKTGAIDGEVVVVGSDNPKAYGLVRAQEAGIPTFVVDYRLSARQQHRSVWPEDVQLRDLVEKSFSCGLGAGRDYKDRVASLKQKVIAEAQLLNQLESYDLDLLVLAGYMRLFTSYFLDRFNTNPDMPRIMNIHPALLPAFPGQHGYEDAFDYGCKWGGITVHFVDYGEDTGPIIAQDVYPIGDDDTIGAVKKRGLELEHELYPRCIQLFAEGRLQLVRYDELEEKGRTKVRTLPQAV